jgi:hypothetical protein
MIVYIILATITFLGLSMLIWPRVLRDAIERFYKDRAIERHLHWPGYVFSIRLVGIGWFVLGGYFLIAFITGTIPKSPPIKQRAVAVLPQPLLHQ